jgi:hypothetical protein
MLSASRLKTASGNRRKTRTCDDIGKTESVPSVMSISKTDESIDTIFVKFLCESITAFGVPVVPDVKIKDATEFDKIFSGRSACRSRSIRSSVNSKTSSNVKTETLRLFSFNLSAKSGFSSKSFGLKTIADASPVRAKFIISSTELAGSIGIAVRARFQNAEIR